MKGRSRIIREEFGGEISWEGENSKKIKGGGHRERENGRNIREKQYSIL